MPQMACPEENFTAGGPLAARVIPGKAGEDQSFTDGDGIGSAPGAGRWGFRPKATGGLTQLPCARRYCFLVICSPGVLHVAPAATSAPRTLP